MYCKHSVHCIFLKGCFFLSYKIITETNTDLPQNIIDELDVHAIPMLFTQCDKEYKNYADGRELNHFEFYEKLAQGHMSTTAQISMDTFANEVKPYLDAGLDIIYIAFSSSLSGTFSTCNIAAQELREEYPERKIILVDTLSASMGEGMLVYYAAKMQKEGKSIEEVEQWVLENRLKLAHWFSVEDLHHLKRGGRLSGASAAIGTVMNIKPILYINDEGKLVPNGKVRGRKQSLDELANKVIENAVDIENEYVFICHANCEDDAKYIANKIKYETKPKETIINMIGPVIGGHAGQGAVAVFFFAKSRSCT